MCTTTISTFCTYKQCEVIYEKNIKKIGPDYNLAAEQFPELNRDFYNNYPQKYFLDKLDEVILKIAQPERLISAFSGSEIAIGMLRASLDSEEESSIIAKRIANNAKIELHELYIHCLECFIRLFISRASLNPCIWLEMNRFTFAQYHEAIPKLASGNFEWLNNQLDTNTTILYALTSLKEPSETITVEIIENWKSWVVFCANELMDIKAYNAYKHGLTLYASPSGFCLQNGENDFHLDKHGDAITYIARAEKENRYVWAKKTEFLDADIMCMHTHIFGSLISSMISAGKNEISHIDDEQRWYPNEKLTPSTLENMRECSDDL